MSELSRAQLLVYAAIGVALLLLGARWVRSSDAEGDALAAPRVSAEQGEKFSVERGGGAIVVHVAGAVRKPAVYRLAAGSRVADAIERAGGAERDAILDAINLAAPLADGQQVVLPERAPGAATASTGAVASGPVSLGSATVEDLDTIEGIGPVTAGEIIEFRDQNGGIASVEELDQISGIGPTTMEALRDGLQP